MSPQQRTRLLNFIDEAYLDAITERWATAILSQIDCAEPPTCLISLEPIMDAASGRIANDVVAIVEERDGLCHAFMFKQRHLEDWFLARPDRVNPATNQPVDDAYSCLIPLSRSLNQLDNALHDYLTERGDDALSEDDLPVCVRDLLTAGACVDVVRSAHDRPRLFPLVIAACRGNIAVVRCLVETFSANVNVIDDSSYSVLERAARLGHAAVVRYLIEHGADVQAEYDDGERGVNALRMAAVGGHLSLVVDLIDEFNADIDFHVPYVVSSALAGAARGHLDFQVPATLSCALAGAARGHLDVVQELVRRGANVNVKQGVTPLVIAAIDGHLDIVQYLVVEARAQVDFADVAGYTPLMAASQGGHLDIVEFLLASGAQVDLGDGPLPLLRAAFFGHLDVVRLFVEHGHASINALGPNRSASSLALAAHRGHLNVVEWLAGHGAEVDTASRAVPVVEAAANGHLDIVRFLVERAGADVNFASDGRKAAALAAAAAPGHLDVVQWLIGHGADVNPDHSAVPMIEAAENGHVDIVRILLDNGARLDWSNADGYCSLIAASNAGHTHVVELLCLRGASMYATAGNVSWWTAMHQAVMRGHVDVVGTLLRLPDLDVNALNDASPLTMMQTACVSSAPESLAICRLLIGAGADVDATGSVKAVPAPLLIAASTGSLDLVELLVDAGADLLVKNAERQTALMIAASKGHADLVSYLLGRLLADRRVPARQFSANVNVIDDSGFSVLERTALLGHAAVVRYLIEHGADVQAEYEDGERGVNALRMAAEGGHLSLVVDLIDEFNADIDFHVPGVKSTALAGAARGHLDVVQELVRRGAKVNVNHGETPLVVAAFDGHLDIVQYLVVEARAQVDFADADGITPLTAASTGGHLDVIEFLLASGAQVDLGDGPQPLLYAAYFGHLDVVRLFVEHGHASINALGPNRSASALALAAVRGRLDVVEWLAGHGAEVNTASRDVPLVEAAANGHLDIVRFLVERAGADVNFASAGCKAAALAAAAAPGHLDVVQWLIGHGADVNPDRGAVPIVEAAENGHVDVVRILLDKGARLDRSNDDGDCPLIVAAKAGHANVVELLCLRGASMYAAAGNVLCWVAMQQAVERGHVDVVGALLRLPNLNVNARNDTSPLTMMQTACISRAPDSLAICRLLIGAGADVDATGSVNGTPAPLLIAASTGSLDLVELLVGAGADLLVKNAERQTALMIAASKGRADLVSYLLGRLLADRRIPARRVARQFAKAKVAAVDGDHVDLIGDIVEKSESFATRRRSTSSCAIQ
ncbi:unnamed protein product (mitochondrion) [Plasmodiophora brassicae]|uniref:Uncharacterized protein n=1 Tax=Plasmodiophora brassicae TaxID=37360 RepID=A0A0G4J2Y2_PLABS|nr:hypothetical protein PBRA_008646 [Plasmodiophora brassicae]SPQ98518.1 unnamed protein product [Plasmodiophora brassicae]